MVTISLCMIVKNEEDVLERCLKSAADLADEIIIVDTGSRDRTKEIAQQFTDRIYDFVWQDNFAAARNYAFSKASMKYCMWLDADDVILGEDHTKFIELKLGMTGEEDVIMLPYNTAFDEKGQPTFTYYRERLVRNCPWLFWEGEVHEVITPSGQVIYGEASVTHKKTKPGDPERNLRILEAKERSGVPLSPRHKYYYGQELYYHKRYEDAISILEDFLGDEGGWLENKLEACKVLSDCYQQVNQKERALAVLLRSLELDVPRAELCCQLGAYFLDEKKYEQAAFWYETARTRKMNPESGAFVRAECYGYIPNLQLVVCYDRLGQWEKAREYNERAAVFKPDSEAVKYNRSYLESKLKEIKGVY